VRKSTIGHEHHPIRPASQPHRVSDIHNPLRRREQASGRCGPVGDGASAAGLRSFPKNSAVQDVAAVRVAECPRLGPMQPLVTCWSNHAIADPGGSNAGRPRSRQSPWPTRSLAWPGLSWRAASYALSPQAPPPWRRWTAGSLRFPRPHGLR
jgi:hypothetical protein